MENTGFHEKTGRRLRHGFRGSLRILILVLITAAGAANVLIFLNSHFYLRAKELKNDEVKKIALLKKADRFYPWNPDVSFELGMSYFSCFNQEMQRMEFENSRSSLEEAVSSFKRSIRLNPTFAFSHYYYAQALRYLNTTEGASGGDPYEEFKKAILLAGHNSDIHYQAGLLFLPRWGEMPEGDREFIAENFKKILVGPKKAQFINILNTWFLGDRDYSVIEAIMPDHPQLLQQYADFLGEKSLSLSERRRVLIKAESIRFRQAGDLYMSALQEYKSYNLENAERQFRHIVNLLSGIRFYQNLSSSSEEQIRGEEYNRLFSSTLLHLLRSKIDLGASLKDCEQELTAYLERETNLGTLGEFKEDLVERGVLEEKPGENFDDWDKLYFQMLLFSKLKASQNIIRLGRLLKNTIIVVPPSFSPRYVSVLHLIGEANQRAGYLYDAEEHLRKALELAPDNLEILIVLRDVYHRLDDSSAKSRVETRIQRLTGPNNRDLSNKTITKGRPFNANVLMDGGEKIFLFDFRRLSSAIKPLLSIHLNGRVVWEDYLDEDSVSLTLPTNIGSNAIQLTAVNTGINLQNIRF
ncbi:MAG: hypothetical protein ABIK95_04875 [Acidobacteriota bacterium]